MDNNTPQLKTISQPSGSEAIWDGTIKVFDKGNGTENSPYEISEPGHLAYLLKTVLTDSQGTKDKYYVLMNDIILNDTSGNLWYTKASVLPWYTTTDERLCFRGNFDGRGHVVKGLYSNIKGNDTRAALFPTVGPGSIIKNVGIAESYLSASYAAGIAGYRRHEDGSDPVFSNVMVNKDVILEGDIVGGIISGLPRAVVIENSYSLAILAGSRYNGGLIGWRWGKPDEYGYNKIRNSYALSEVPVSIEGGTGENSKHENAYSPLGQENLAPLPHGQMIGADARKNMVGFNFDAIWKTVEKGSPVLRVFNTDKYSIPNIPVTISFAVNGGASVDDVSGFPGEPIPWPNVIRPGYELEGWFVYETLDVPYPGDVFPSSSILLHAKWKSISVEQTFEVYPYIYPGMEGLGDDYRVYLPGTEGYTTEFVHGGMKAMHRIGETENYERFSIFDSNMEELKPGKEYTMSFWLYVESTNNETGFLRLYHAKETDLEDEPYGYQNIGKIGSYQVGEWQEVKFTFIANGSRLWFETPGYSSIYMDDFLMIPTGNSGKLGNLDWLNDKIELPNIETENPDSEQPNMGDNKTFLLHTVLIIALAGVSVLCIRIRRYRRKNKMVF